VARIYRKWTERKIKAVRGEGQFGYRKGKFGDVIVTLRIISERNLDTDDEFFS
jgi:hypothetical protein